MVCGCKRNSTNYNHKPQTEIRIGPWGIICGGGGVLIVGGLLFVAKWQMARRWSESGQIWGTEECESVV